MNWRALIFFLFASFSVCYCSHSDKFSDEMIGEFKRLEDAFSAKKMATFRDPSYRFHDGSNLLFFHDLCKHAFVYALQISNWSLSYHLFTEFWRGPSIIKIFPFAGPYCHLALANNEMNQVKQSFNLIRDRALKRLIVEQAIRERKFVLVGFDKGMNWELLSQRDFLRIFRLSIKYRQFDQVYQCLGTKVENFASSDNYLLHYALRYGYTMAIEVLIAHHEVFGSRPDSLDIQPFVDGLNSETPYSEYMCYYYVRYNKMEHMLYPFWQNFYRLDWIPNSLATLLLNFLERSPMRQGQSPFSLLARVVRILSASDLPLSVLKKSFAFFERFGVFSVAINSGNTRFIDYVLKRIEPDGFHFDAVAYAEDSLTKGICYALNQAPYIKFLKLSYVKGHLEQIISILRLVGQHNSFNKLQATQITKSLLMNFPEIVWIVSKNITPYYFSPREGCWLMEAVDRAEYTGKLPKGWRVADKWGREMKDRVHSHRMMRLILATYGAYDADDSMNLIAMCFFYGDYDAALMALRSANGQFQLESPRPYLPGIVNLDLPFANKLFSRRRFFPVIKLEESVPQYRFSTDRVFYDMLINQLLPIIEADHRPLLRCILNDFDIRPHDILSNPDLDPHHGIIGTCYGRPDWTKLGFKSYGPVLVFITTCPWEHVQKVLPFFGTMNTLQVIKACLSLESASHKS